jgi:hypothetical protein
VIRPASRFPGLVGRAAVWATVAALVAGGAAFAGCGSDDDGDETVATPTTTETEATGPTGPSGGDDDGGGSGGGGGGGEGEDPTPEDTGPVVPESGGVGADDYDPEQDTEENDTPPPAGGPQEQFEQFCEDNPGACD